MSERAIIEPLKGDYQLMTPSNEHQDPRLDDDLQDELQRRYVEQQRRMLCPGCGEVFECY